MDRSVLVIFDEKIPSGFLKGHYDSVVAPASLREAVERAGFKWKALDELMGPGSVHVAGAMARSLPALVLPNGSPVAKAALYKGYELWWTHQTDLFLNFCLPFTQYQKLLEYCKDYPTVVTYRSPHRALFSCYFRAHGATLAEIGKPMFSSPLGIVSQIILTVVSLPVLMIRRYRRLVFIGDKFEPGRDHDFRMRYIYEEMRQRQLPFVEFIRSPERWTTVLTHAWRRKRPAVYFEAVVSVARWLSSISGGHVRARREFGGHLFANENDAMRRFHLLVATQYLLTLYDDIWAIRLMRWILRSIGVKTAIMIAASDRNWPIVIGCKLNGIPTVGILHGINTHHYNMYDFLPGFIGSKMLSVDKYGLWSEWWKEYYIKESDAYRPEQLFVSGPMRPLAKAIEPVARDTSLPVRVLFISEQVAAPLEVLPYLKEVLSHREFEFTIKFRPSRDGFEQWLTEHHPELLKGVKSVRGTMQEAIAECDVVVGTHSTAVLESLFQYKVPLFFNTHKWGDYFSLKDYGNSHPFFANTPELLKGVKSVRGTMQEAIAECDLVVGTHSTAVLESLFQYKVPLFFNTYKWGDYFSLKDYGNGHPFFANTPEELIERIRSARTVSRDAIAALRERFFGDPTKNGSAWVVDELEAYVQEKA